MNARIRSWSAPMLAMMLLLGCKEDELNEPLQPSAPVTVQLTETSWTMTENGDGKVVVFGLNKPATKAGQLTVIMESERLMDFQFEPALVDGKAKLSIQPGISSVSLLIRSIDNNKLDGSKTLAIKAAQVSEGFQLGSNRVGTISVADNETPVHVAFQPTSGVLFENAGDGLRVTLSFSGASVANGNLTVSISSDNMLYGQHYATLPEAIDGLVTLPVSVGANQVTFKVVPINDVLVNGERSLQFDLHSLDPGFVEGEEITQVIQVKDDELAQRPKGYQIQAAGWKYKRIYEYKENGDISKINWEQYTPAYKGGTYTYEYFQGRVHKMVENQNRETYYEWEENRIVKTEQYTNGLLTKYTIYGYDQAGNVGEAAVFDLQPNGEMVMSSLFVYLYFTDGNIYKKLVYAPKEGEEEPVLVSAHTYDGYSDRENPFSMEEILPNVNSQPKLPSSYQIEMGGKTYMYSFFYEFDENDRPLRRTTSSSAGTEVAEYLY